MNTANLTYEVGGVFVVQQVPECIQVLLKLVGLIDKHFIQHRSPAFYAQTMSISEVVLNKYSRMVFGQTVYEIIQEKLHREAVYLLVKTDWSVKRISYEIGCCDPCYFNRCFKKKTGRTPRRYRLLHSS